MEKKVRIYNLHDPKQYEDERKYWEGKTSKEKLEVLELLRQQYIKLTQPNGTAEQGLQRVYRVIERKQS